MSAQDQQISPESRLLMACGAEKSLELAGQSQEKTVKKLLNRLRDKGEIVLRLRYGIGGNAEHTLEQISVIVGVGKERVRQIQDKGLRVLRGMIDGYYGEVLKTEATPFPTLTQAETLYLAKIEPFLSEGLTLGNIREFIFGHRKPTSLSVDVKDRTVWILGLSVRGRKTLKKLNIETLEQLSKTSKTMLIRTKCCGATTVREIARVFHNATEEELPEQHDPDAQVK